MNLTIDIADLKSATREMTWKGIVDDINLHTRYYGGPPFLTGSYVYGKLNDESDLDLVVPMSRSAAEKLSKMSDASRDQRFYKYSNSGDMVSLRFGMLNVLAVFSKSIYEGWEASTQMCIALKMTNKRPITHDEAVEVFKSVFAARGLT